MINPMLGSGWEKKIPITDIFGTICKTFVRSVDWIKALYTFLKVHYIMKILALRKYILKNLGEKSYCLQLNLKWFRKMCVCVSVYECVWVCMHVEMDEGEKRWIEGGRKGENGKTNMAKY